jgi:hypothetical protein
VGPLVGGSRRGLAPPRRAEARSHMFSAASLDPVASGFRPRPQPVGMDAALSALGVRVRDEADIQAEVIAAAQAAAAKAAAEKATKKAAAKSSSRSSKQAAELGSTSATPSQLTFGHASADAALTVSTERRATPICGNSNPEAAGIAPPGTTLCSSGNAGTGSDGIRGVITAAAAPGASVCREHTASPSAPEGSDQEQLAADAALARALASSSREMRMSVARRRASPGTLPRQHRSAEDTGSDDDYEPSDEDEDGHVDEDEDEFEMDDDEILDDEDELMTNARRLSSARQGSTENEDELEEGEIIEVRPQPKGAGRGAAVSGKRPRSKAAIQRLEQSPYGSSDEDVEDKDLGQGVMVPGRLWGKLFEHQRVCIQWLCGLHSQDVGGIVGDEMYATAARPSIRATRNAKHVPVITRSRLALNFSTCK